MTTATQTTVTTISRTYDFDCPQPAVLVHVERPDGSKEIYYCIDDDFLDSVIACHGREAEMEGNEVVFA